MWSSVAESTTEYCNTGDMIGVKGRIQTRIIESPDGIKRKKTEIVAEKVTFLTSSPNHKKLAMMMILQMKHRVFESNMNIWLFFFKLSRLLF